LARTYSTESAVHRVLNKMLPLETFMLQFVPGACESAVEADPVFLLAFCLGSVVHMCITTLSHCQLRAKIQSEGWENTELFQMSRSQALIRSGYPQASKLGGSWLQCGLICFWTPASSQWESVGPLMPVREQVLKEWRNRE